MTPPCHPGAILPKSVGVVKRQQSAGRAPRTPWRAGSYGQTRDLLHLAHDHAGIVLVLVAANGRRA